MMFNAVIAQAPTTTVGPCQAVPTIYDIDGPLINGKRCGVLNTDELLQALENKGIRNVDIARALNLPDSRIPMIKKRTRALKLDEAVKLVQVFGLRSDERAAPLPVPVLRLIVQYIVSELGLKIDAESEPRVEDLLKDVQAFSEFAAEPKVRSSVEAAEGFFRAMRLRRPVTALKDRSETRSPPA